MNLINAIMLTASVGGCVSESGRLVRPAAVYDSSRYKMKGWSGEYLNAPGFAAANVNGYGSAGDVRSQPSLRLIKK